MRKLFAVLLAILLVSSVAVADAPDLSDLTYEQLIALQHYFTAEIVSRPEWQEIEIPAGDWTIGVDIPAGYYSIKSTDNRNIVRIEDSDGRAAGIYKTLGKDEVVGKTLFPEGMIFSCWHPVLLSPPIIPGL